MKKGFDLSQEDFDRLLGWFSPDRDEAGREYEEMRAGLIRFFRFKGLPAPETFADETINRVALRLAAVTPRESVKKLSFFYGFAVHIHREYIARKLNQEVSFDPRLHLPDGGRAAENSKDKTLECLEACLRLLSEDERKLIIGYYEKDKTAKIEERQKLAAAKNIRTRTLNMRIHRIRMDLKKCIKKCLNEK